MYVTWNKNKLNHSVKCILIIYRKRDKNAVVPEVLLNHRTLDWVELFFYIKNLIREKTHTIGKAMFKLASKQSHTAEDYVNFYKSKSVHYRLPLTAPGVEVWWGGGIP